MLDDATAELVKHLDHPNGWWRDNAQKEIVIRQDKSVVKNLKQIAAGKPGPLDHAPSALGRLHALWTLSGLEVIDKQILLTAIKDEDAQVRKAAVWISEPLLRKGDADLLKAFESLKHDMDYDVRIQLFLSLSATKSPNSERLTEEIIKSNSNNEVITGVVQSLKRNDDIKNMGAKLGSLSPENRKLIMDGSIVFNSLCATCHGPQGKGVPTKLAPPLAGNFMRYLGKKDGLIRILLHGLTGPVNGDTYTENMVAMGMNDDEWIASVLSYLRYDIGLSENPYPGTMTDQFINFLLVKPGEVKKIRDGTMGRTKPWTWAELDKLND